MQPFIEREYIGYDAGFAIFDRAEYDTRGVEQILVDGPNRNDQTVAYGIVGRLILGKYTI